jgi:hypothetical protein
MLASRFVPRNGSCGMGGWVTGLATLLWYETAGQHTRRNDPIYLCSSSFANSYAYPIYSYDFVLTIPSNSLFFHQGTTPISQKTPNEVLMDGMVSALNIQAVCHFTYLR